MLHRTSLYFGAIFEFLRIERKIHRLFGLIVEPQGWPNWLRMSPFSLLLVSTNKSNGGCSIDTPPGIFNMRHIPDTNAAVEAVYSSDWGRIVATLIRSFGDFEVAEEAAQEAFAAAVDQWREKGVPDSPPPGSSKQLGTRL